MDMLTQTLKPLKLGKFGLRRKPKTHNALDDSVHSQDDPAAVTVTTTTLRDVALNCPSHSYPISTSASQSKQEPEQNVPCRTKSESLPRRQHRSEGEPRPSVVVHHHDSDDEEDSDEEDDLYARFAAAGAVPLPSLHSTQSGSSFLTSSSSSSKQRRSPRRTQSSNTSSARQKSFRCDDRENERERSTVTGSSRKERPRRPSMLGTSTTSPDKSYNNNTPSSSHRRERRPSMVTSPHRPYDESDPTARTNAPSRTRQQRRMSASALPASHAGSAFEEVYYAPPPGSAGDESKKIKTKKSVEPSQSFSETGSRTKRRSSLSHAPSSASPESNLTSSGDARHSTSHTTSSNEPVRRGVQRRASLSVSRPNDSSNDKLRSRSPRKKKLSGGEPENESARSSNRRSR